MYEASSIKLIKEVTGMTDNFLMPACLLADNTVINSDFEGGVFLEAGSNSDHCTDAHTGVTPEFRESQPGRFR